MISKLFNLRSRRREISWKGRRFSEVVHALDPEVVQDLLAGKAVCVEGPTAGQHLRLEQRQPERRRSFEGESKGA